MFAGLSEKRGRKENQGRVSWLEDILLGFVSDHRVMMILGGFVSDHRVVMILWGVVGLQLGGGGVMILQVPRETLEFAGMSINFRSGKFGYSMCPIFSKGHAKIFREFSMTLLKIGHMGYLRLMHGPGYLST